MFVVLVCLHPNDMGAVKGTSLFSKKAASKTRTVVSKKQKVSVIEPATLRAASAGATLSSAVSDRSVSPTLSAASTRRGSILNTMSNVTTANTNISMSTGNYFGSGATIMNANLGNVNISVAPSVTSSGPLAYY